MDAGAAVDIYRNFGTAALFIVLYITTIFMFIRDLQHQRRQQQVIIEKVIKAVDDSTSVNRECLEVMKATRESIETSARQTGEFIAFLKGRDDREN